MSIRTFVGALAGIFVEMSGNELLEEVVRLLRVTTANVSEVIRKSMIKYALQLATEVKASGSSLVLQFFSAH